MARLNLSEINFTNKADVINSDGGIFNPAYSNVKTLKGADRIIGTDSVNGDFGFGVLVGVAAEDFDDLIVSAEFSGRARIAANGIKNKGTIDTNQGRDVVSGTATANLSATAETVSQAIAIAETADTGVITNAFAAIEFKATADGIDNSGGEINTNKGADTVEGETKGSIAAVARATADASAIVETIAEAPISQELTAFAGAIAQSLARAEIAAKGINNKQGTITTGKGKDTIAATATSSTATLSEAAAFAVSSAPPENQALAQAVANAFAEASDQAIAIDNTGGSISTGKGGDTIEATAEASDKAIAIKNSQGVIRTGDGKDTIIAKATGSESYGIFGGDILTGAGADEVRASSFGGGVNIDMGDGKDFVEGFGNAKLDGSAGFDTLSFGSSNKSDFNIYTDNNFTVFELGGITMQTRGFENYIFADGSYSYDSLMG
jgi:hypothetical protein